MSAYSYFAYGMGIRSQIPLPELPQATLETDLVICRGDNRAALLEIPGESGWVRLEPREAVLYLENIGTIVVRDGKQVVVDMDPLVDPGLIRQCLLGTVMGVVLGQRGKLVLHASSVVIDDCAVAFLGESGLGKSCLAAALMAGGHQLIADDVTAVESGLVPVVVPSGVPHLKIAREAAAALGFTEDKLVSLWNGEKKAGLRTPALRSNAPVPLKRIFILEEGDASQIVPLRPTEAVFDLIVNAYPTCLPQESDTTLVIRCSALVKKVPVFRLTRTSDLATLPELAQTIEEHLQST